MDLFLIFLYHFSMGFPWVFPAIPRGQVMREESLVEDRDSQLQRWVVEGDGVGVQVENMSRLLKTAVTFQYISRCRVYVCVYIYIYIILCIYIYIYIYI